MSRQSHNLEQAAARAAPATRTRKEITMPIEITVKQSGSKKWLWITGPLYLLYLIACALGEAIKPAAGNQPNHIDFTLKN